MAKTNSKMKWIIVAAVLVVFIAVVIIVGAGSDENPFMNTFWSLVPPIVAIALALITKEVYSSLFIGILVGGFLYADLNPVGALEHVFVDGMVGALSDGWNVGILVFLVVLGAMVALMNKAGGSAAFGRWSSERIKSRKGAQMATMGLGVLIFVDDYFNCLTVGSVMRPVTDKHKVSRAKLAYLIDATAAPVCIIAPISSWAAAVTGSVPESMNGFQLFINSIPYNFYALLTLVMIICLVVMDFDYGPMKLHEKNAREKDDLYTTPERPYENAASDEVTGKGKVIDLVLPVVMLILCCVIGMIYTGGFFDGETFIDAFANSDASVGLMLGSVVALILTLILYLPRKVLSFNECMGALPEGFRAMVPAILILTFAWTLNSMTQSLGSTMFVETAVRAGADKFLNFLPAVVFLIAIGISFATGTSWGTFGILIPIVIEVFGVGGGEILIIGISACLAGAVCGDHCSPISDTTIMASAGAQSDHINHVSTQLPYALTVAAISLVCYIVTGFVQMWYVMLPVGILLTVGCMFLIKKLQTKKA